MTRFIVLLATLLGCCQDADSIASNMQLGNVVTFERGRVCVDSTERGLSFSAKVCSRRCDDGGV